MVSVWTRIELSDFLITARARWILTKICWSQRASDHFQSFLQSGITIKARSSWVTRCLGSLYSGICIYKQVIDGTREHLSKVLHLHSRLVQFYVICRTLFVVVDMRNSLVDYDDTLSPFPKSNVHLKHCITILDSILKHGLVLCLDLLITYNVVHGSLTRCPWPKK